MIKAWACISMIKQEARRTFGRRPKREGVNEYVIKIPGFKGELRKSMTPEEARDWANKSNKAAFMSAAQASKGGMYGVEQFTQFGKSQTGMGHVMMRAASRGFGKPKEGPKDDGSTKVEGSGSKLRRKGGQR